jgi:hypothetical protein
MVATLGVENVPEQWLRIISTATATTIVVSSHSETVVNANDSLLLSVSTSKVRVWIVAVAFRHVRWTLTMFEVRNDLASHKLRLEW